MPPSHSVPARKRPASNAVTATCPRWLKLSQGISRSNSCQARCASGFNQSGGAPRDSVTLGSERLANRFLSCLSRPMRRALASGVRGLGTVTPPISELRKCARCTQRGPAQRRAGGISTPPGVRSAILTHETAPPSCRGLRARRDGYGMGRKMTETGRTRSGRRCLRDRRRHDAQRLRLLRSRFRGRFHIKAEWPIGPGGLAATVRFCTNS
jgi:hypothetical protein